MTIEGGTPTIEMLTMITDDYLKPESAVEKRIAEHILDSLSMEGLEAFAGMLHRLDVRAMAAGKREAEHAEFDMGFEAASREHEAERKLVDVVDQFRPESISEMGLDELLAFMRGRLVSFARDTSLCRERLDELEGGQS